MKSYRTLFHREIYFVLILARILLIIIWYYGRFQLIFKFKRSQTFYLDFETIKGRFDSRLESRT